MPEASHVFCSNWDRAHAAYSRAYHAGLVRILPRLPAVPANTSTVPCPINSPGVNVKIAIEIASTPPRKITGPGSTIQNPITLPSTPVRAIPRARLSGPGVPGDILRFKYFGITPPNESLARIERADALITARLRQEEKDYMASFGYVSPSPTSSCDGDDESDNLADAATQPRIKKKSRRRSESVADIDTDDSDPDIIYNAAAKRRAKGKARRCFDSTKQQKLIAAIIMPSFNIPPASAEASSAPRVLASGSTLGSPFPGVGPSAGPSTLTRRPSLRASRDDDSSGYGLFDFDIEDPVFAACLDDPVLTSSPKYCYRRD